MIISIITFLLILSVLILIHEAGHFFTAKKFGMKVEEFGFGMPLTRAIFSIKYGETVYSIYPALIGGFVKLYGEDEAGAGRISLPEGHNHTPVHIKDENRIFYARPLWQRFSVVFAGVVMNTLLAVVIFYVFMFISNFHTELPYLGNHHFFLVNQQVIKQIIISDVAKNSPAEKAGITPFSKIILVNGESITDPEIFSNFVKNNKGKNIAITWQNMNTQIGATSILTLRENPPKGEGSLGVSFYPAETVELSYDTPSQKLLSGFIHPANLLTYNFVILKSLIDTSVKEKNVAPVSQAVSGPLGIYKIVGEFVHIPDVKTRIVQLLNLLGLLSISLAFFNLLPIPGLDGGRLFFIIIEAVIGKKLNPKFEAYANMIGMVLLIGLILLITVKDIMQFFL